MALKRYQIGTAAVVTLVALRVGIGWHFFKEGAKKFHDPDFTAAVFLQEAKGPLAGMFRTFIPDREGRGRLDRDATKEAWSAYADRVATHFGLDDGQRKAVDRVRTQWQRRIDWFFADNREQIDEYFLELGRLHDAKADTTTRDVAFQRDWIAGKEAELRGKLRNFSGKLAAMAQEYQRELHAIATAQQRDRGDVAPLSSTSSWLDTIVKYFIISVGVCLVVGLFTRTASIAGAVFLLSVIATQPPWVQGTQPTYYQSVELLALLLLAAMGAGLYAGLDFFTYCIRMRRFPRDIEERIDEPDA